MHQQSFFLSIKTAAIRTQSILQQFGFSPLALLHSIAALPRYLCSYLEFSGQVEHVNGARRNHPSTYRMGCMYPVLTDYRQSAGSNSGHYYHQDLYVAKKIFKNNPGVHLDIGSRIDGFIAHLLAFEQKIILGDVRPVIDADPNISCMQIDLSHLPKSRIKEQYSSISSLHVIEHVGLGRYGDKINPIGHIQAIRHLSLLLSQGGSLYISFPISCRSRIEFNAHRVISIAEAHSIFKEMNLAIREFAYVDDVGNLNRVSHTDSIDVLNSYHLQYGCGIWTLTR